MVRHPFGLIFGRRPTEEEEVGRLAEEVSSETFLKTPAGLAGAPTAFPNGRGSYFRKPGLRRRYPGFAEEVRLSFYSLKSGSRAKKESPVSVSISANNDVITGKISHPRSAGCSAEPSGIA